VVQEALMMYSRWLIIPFVLQMLCMVADEFYFHSQRTLPRWERLGHPVDTLTVLLCWGVVLFVEPTPLAIALYAALSVFSCLFVTKDEWVHTTFCRAGEHWLHALLFLLHPLTFLSAGFVWRAIRSPGAPAPAFGWIQYEGFERTFFAVNAAVTLLFGLYQLIYWNLLWKNALQAKSTTASITR
jgi:hypothetical protein